MNAGALSPHIRSEYRKLAADLPLLAAGFGIRLPSHIVQDAAVLAFSMECIDRLLDDLSQSQRRRDFSAAVMAFLTREDLEAQNPDFTAELVGWLRCLRAMVERHGVAGPFYQAAREIFINTEVMRSTTNVGCYVACVIREGQLTVELLLLLVGSWCSVGFQDFFRALAGAGNLVDKIRDVRADYRRGELAIPPGLWFRLRLWLKLLRQLPRIARRMPSPVRFLRWGLGYLFPCWSRFSPPCISARFW